MRFVWAVVAFVLAAILIGAGIAQRTIFLGPKAEHAQISVAQDLPFTVIDGAALTQFPGTQTLTIQGEGTVFVAYGRTPDVLAWLSDATYNHVIAGTDGTVDVEVVPATVTPSEPEDVEPTTGRNPAGSDLWLEEFTQTDRFVDKLSLPDTMSVLVAADGTQPAPASIALSWPISNSTPWAGPLIVLGAILIAVGIFLYILGIRHVRRSRGPRRKGVPPLPVTEPLDMLPEAQAKGVISSGTARREASPANRALRVVPLVVVSAVLLTGCSPEAWPQWGASPTPSPTPEIIEPENQQAAVVTESQAEEILRRAAQVVSEADANADPALAATRLAGPTLAERETNYQIRGEIAEHAQLPPIPTRAMGFTLPQAYDGWPRSIMMVVGEDEGAESTDAPAEGETPAEAETPADGEPSEEDEAPADGETATTAPTIVLLQQADPWSEYKITYLAKLATTMPEVAGATIGASQVPPDSTFLLIAPNAVAAAYSDVLNKGEESEFAAIFAEEGDQFRAKVAEDRATRLAEFNKTAAETGSLTFSSAPGEHDAVALATLESGAIVAVTLTETDTVAPTNEDAVIKLDNNPTVQALAGTGTSATGFNTNFSDQLFFYVPNQAAGGKVQLLGFGSNILSAGVIS